MKERVHSQAAVTFRLERMLSDDDFAHVWPVDDEWVHEMSRMCGCFPRTEPWHPQVVIHRRFLVH